MPSLGSQDLTDRRIHSGPVQRFRSKLSPSVPAAGSDPIGPGRLGCLGTGRTGGGRAGICHSASPEKETPPFGGVRSLLVRRRAGGPAFCLLFTNIAGQSRRLSPPGGGHAHLPSLPRCPPQGGRFVGVAASAIPGAASRSGWSGAQHPLSGVKRDNLRAKSRQPVCYQRVVESAARRPLAIMSRT